MSSLQSWRQVVENSTQGQHLSPNNITERIAFCREVEARELANVEACNGEGGWDHLTSRVGSQRVPSALGTGSLPAAQRFHACANTQRQRTNGAHFN